MRDDRQARDQVLGLRAHVGALNYVSQHVRVGGALDGWMPWARSPDTAPQDIVMRLAQEAEALGAHERDKVASEHAQQVRRVR
jgi:hypothetical protein